MAAIHSAVLRRVSRAKSCRCVTSRDMRYVSRASPLCELMRTALGVMLSMVRSSSAGAGGGVLVGFAAVARGRGAAAAAVAEEEDWSDDDMAVGVRVCEDGGSGYRHAEP